LYAPSFYDNSGVARLDGDVVIERWGRGTIGAAHAYVNHFAYEATGGDDLVSTFQLFDSFFVGAPLFLLRPYEQKIRERKDDDHLKEKGAHACTTRGLWCCCRDYGEDCCHLSGDSACD
jgi:hypothetical protein